LQAEFNQGLSGEQLISIYGGSYDTGYTVLGGNQAGIGQTVQRTAPDVRVLQFDGNGDVGFYSDLGNKQATFVVLREATALADANVSDILRPVSGPIDTGLSALSIGRGNGTWGDYAAVTLAALPLVGKGVGILRAGGAAGSSVPQVTANRIAGNAFRDEIAGALRAEGRDVTTEIYKSTPFGRRFIDIEVSKNGQVLGGIETKLGSSRYTPAQRAKDYWLKINDGYIVNVVRDR